LRSYHLMSASWDQTIKIWNLSGSGLTSLTTLNGHESMVYSGCWNPKFSGKNLIQLQTCFESHFLRKSQITQKSIHDFDFF